MKTKIKPFSRTHCGQSANGQVVLVAAISFTHSPVNSRNELDYLEEAKQLQDAHGLDDSKKSGIVYVPAVVFKANCAIRALCEGAAVHVLRLVWGFMLGDGGQVK